VKFAGDQMTAADWAAPIDEFGFIAEKGFSISESTIIASTFRFPLLPYV
jgi:hypothetical protein